MRKLIDPETVIDMLHRVWMDYLRTTTDHKERDDGGNDDGARDVASRILYQVMSDKHTPFAESGYFQTLDPPEQEIILIMEFICATLKTRVDHDKRQSGLE